jgi:hypothetical protein
MTLAVGSNALADVLRPPWPGDPSATAYKDWLHLNVFDHSTGSVGLINVSLHGAPTDHRSRAVGAALVHVPGGGWIGNLDVSAIDEARVGVSSVALEQVALAADVRDGTVRASARMPTDALHATLEATPTSRPIEIERQFPFGRGWISWFVIPRLSLRGEIRAGDMSLDLATATAYHDHNWGRWHWGDDVGWDWAAFSAPSPGPTIVIARATDRERRSPSRWSMIVDQDSKRRAFIGATVSVSRSGIAAPPERRLPGAVGALHADRVAPRLPAQIQVVADDGIDHVVVDFRVRASAQIIAADPMRRGAGFINESVGEFSATLSIDGRTSEATGLGVLEYVD